MFYTFEGIENVRDLGGLARPDGARIRDGRLLRAGHLGYASAADIRRLADWGVRYVVDLRDGDERRRAPDKTVPGAENVWLAPAPDLKVFLYNSSATTPAETHRAFHEFYRYLALHPDSIGAYAAFFQKLLAAEGAPVLWHCTQGKDRTGVAGFLLLAALGFDRETAVEEYMLTNRFAAGQMEAMRLARASEEELALMAEVFPVFEENARYWYKCVDMEYGGVENYLELALGLTPEDRARLEEAYLAF